VALFIGSPPMSVIQATVRDGGARVEADGLELPLRDALRAAARPLDGRSVHVGIRPEHVVDPSSPAHGPTATLQADVELVEPLGDEAVVHARVGGHPLTYRVEPRRMPEVGRRVAVAVELERLHLFDGESGARLG